MKRKIVMTLCVVACTGMLFGCGQKEAMNRLEEAASAMETAEDNDAVSDSQNLMTEQEEGDSQETMTSPISEYLGNGRKILYRSVQGMPDKKSVPYLYFFEDGKVTYMEQRDLGLSMGELSQMTDEAIWEKMEEFYEMKYASLSDRLDQLEENKLKAGIMYMVLNEEEQDISGFAKDMVIQMYMHNSDVDLPAYSTADDTTPEYWEEWANTFSGGQEEIKKVGEEVCSQMKSYMPEVKDLGRGIPVAFIVETDATGNNVEDEGIVWMDVNGKAYKKIVIKGKGTIGNIYDSAYVCYPADSSDTICVRDDTEIIFDGTDSDKVYVDVPIAFSDVQALFQ